MRVGVYGSLLFPLAETRMEECSCVVAGSDNDHAVEKISDFHAATSSIRGLETTSPNNLWGEKKVKRVGPVLAGTEVGKSRPVEGTKPR